MFCFGLQSIARFINTNAYYFNTQLGWRVKENFPETFKSQLEKNKNVIHRPRSVRIGRNCAFGLSNQDLGHSFSQYTDLPAGE